MILGTALVLTVPAFFSWNASIRRTIETLPDLGPAPILQGHDQYGNSLSSAQLNPNDWIFGFLKPDDTGLVLASSFAEIDRNLRSTKNVLVLSMLAQPSLNQEQLATYAARNEASIRWRFISAPPEELGRIRSAWGETINRIDSTDAKSTWFALIDREGHLRQVYDANSPEAVQKLLTDLGSLLRSEKK